MSKYRTAIIYGATVAGIAGALQFFRPGAQAGEPSAVPGHASAKAWIVPDVGALPDSDWCRTVRYGRDLIARTASLIGPEVADPQHRFAGNNLNCQNCHLQAGTKEYGLALIGVYADFPNYRARSGNVGTMEDRIEGCLTRSMNGKPIPQSSPEMTAIVSYLKFLSTGRPVGAPTPGRGSGRMIELSRAADPARGKVVFAQACAACHGADGLGERAGRPGDAKGYLIPPLWGPDSYNDGAGMARLISAANFIHSNMPNGTTWKQRVLSPADAWDVSAYVDSQPRPHKSGLDRDFPNLTQKPVDAAYGPYADHFSAAQHKYGPFTPIRAAIKALEADK